MLKIISDIKDSPVASGGPNFAYDLLLKSATPQILKNFNLSNWQLALNGAEPVRSNTLTDFIKTFAPLGFKKEVFAPSYGMVETTLIISSGDPSKVHTVISVDKRKLKRNIIEIVDKSNNSFEFVGHGKEILDEKILIVDPNKRNILPDKRIGEIWVNSASNTKGYWEKPEISKNTFQDRKSVV